MAAYGFKVEVWGKAALFSRPELRVERVSYDIITPSAARGILEAILWKPAIRYVVDRIYVMNPIRFTNIRRNEVTQKISARNVQAAMNGKTEPIYINTKDVIAQRASLLLKDVRYVIEAHFEMTERAGDGDSPDKFYAIFCRRARKGQCFHQPYFGCREFPAEFRLFEEDEILTAYPGDTRDLGLMLYDLDYRDASEKKPSFFRAILRDGMLDLREAEVFR